MLVCGPVKIHGTALALPHYVKVIQRTKDKKLLYAQWILFFFFLSLKINQGNAMQITNGKIANVSLPSFTLSESIEQTGMIFDGL